MTLKIDPRCLPLIAEIYGWEERWSPGEWSFQFWGSPLREEDIRDAVRKMDAIVLDPSQYKVVDDPLQLQG